jgi:ABC-type glycerol-3-phosphate transport system substrate-binding protein
MRFANNFPYGRAPFWLLVIAVVSVIVRVATAHRPEARPDLVMVTHTEAQFDAYRKAIPRFEREHGVTVQVQYSNWASLQTRLQNAMLAGTDVPDLSECSRDRSASSRVVRSRTSASWT